METGTTGKGSGTSRAALSPKDLFFRRSARMAPRSQSRMSSPSVTIGLWLSPRSCPFWAIRHWPEKIRSWLLSPAPAEA